MGEEDQGKGMACCQNGWQGFQCPKLTGMGTTPESLLHPFVSRAFDSEAQCVVQEREPTPGQSKGVCSLLLPLTVAPCCGVSTTPNCSLASVGAQDTGLWVLQSSCPVKMKCPVWAFYFNEWNFLTNFRKRLNGKIQKVGKYPFRETLIFPDFDQYSIFVTVSKPSLLRIINEDPVYVKIYSLCFAIYKLLKKICV